LNQVVVKSIPSESLRFTKDDQGVLWYKGRICVPIIKELKDKIL
jgi:hypothetical protein